MKRYHPLLVSLHWLAALMIIVALVIGGPSLAKIDNADPQKTSALTGHIIWGLVIGGLMLGRLAMRAWSQLPPHADSGNAALNMGAQAAHWALYLLAFAMIGSGLGIAFSAGLLPIVFGGSDAALPANFDGIGARATHGIISKLFLLFIGLHILGWAYHQFFLRDSLISRMWYGKRSG